MTTSQEDVIPVRYDILVHFFCRRVTDWLKGGKKNNTAGGEKNVNRLAGGVCQVVRQSVHSPQSRGKVQERERHPETQS